MYAQVEDGARRLAGAAVYAAARSSGTSLPRDAAVGEALAIWV